MNTAVLEVRDLNLSIDSSNGPHQLLDGVSFSINAGETTGLVGESGCGKSMTALAILGVLPATGMTIRSAGIMLNGEDLTALNHAQRRRVLGQDISMVFQQPATALDPVFTLGQQIAATVHRHGISGRKACRQTMLESLELVGFSQPEKIAAAYPHELSGGMRQLSMIAMATVCKPAVLIADEPTTALDVSTQLMILQQLKRLQTEYKTAILLISHDLNIIRQCCHTVLVMYCGRLLESTDPESLFSHPRHPYSAGLLGCIPKLSATRPPPINAIAGQVPALTDLPPGCHFAPRCDRAIAQCRHTAPEPESDNGRTVACFRPMP